MAFKGSALAPHLSDRVLVQKQSVIYWIGNASAAVSATAAVHGFIDFLKKKEKWGKSKLWVRKVLLVFQWVLMSLFTSRHSPLQPTLIRKYLIMKTDFTSFVSINRLERKLYAVYNYARRCGVFRVCTYSLSLQSLNTPQLQFYRLLARITAECTRKKMTLISLSLFNSRRQVQLQKTHSLVGQEQVAPQPGWLATLEEMRVAMSQMNHIFVLVLFSQDVVWGLNSLFTVSFCLV